MLLARLLRLLSPLRVLGPTSAIYIDRVKHTFLEQLLQIFELAEEIGLHQPLLALSALPAARANLCLVGSLHSRIVVFVIAIQALVEGKVVCEGAAAHRVQPFLAATLLTQRPLAQFFQATLSLVLVSLHDVVLVLWRLVTFLDARAILCVLVPVVRIFEVLLQLPDRVSFV